MELHDAVIYGFPYKLHPKPKIAHLSVKHKQHWLKLLQVRAMHKLCFMVSAHDRVSFSFSPKWGGKGKGKYISFSVQSMWQSRVVQWHIPLEKFDFEPFIRRNLVESGTGTVFAQTFKFIVSLKLL